MIRYVRKTRSFTLIELIVVVIIIGVLAGLIVPSYLRARERAMDKYAQKTLQIIRAAERSYKTETGTYYPLSGNTGWENPQQSINLINANLNLDLVYDGSWSIVTHADGVAEAWRSGGGYERTWRIEPGTVNATCSGTCP
jgi:prepilin-type N-terminal cleavage/methylation domain-containing protein